MTDFVSLLKQADKSVKEARSCLGQIEVPCEEAQELARRLAEVDTSLVLKKRDMLKVLIELLSAVGLKQVTMPGGHIMLRPEGSNGALEMFHRGSPEPKAYTFEYTSSPNPFSAGEGEGDIEHLFL